jgi:hypothetical protein
MRLPGWYWRAVHRLQNRFMDIRAVLAGACNASTWDGTTYRGGYSHWRCARDRGHTDPHRFNNMIWLDAGPVDYSPIPSGMVEYAEAMPLMTPKWRWARGRTPTDRRRRDRLKRAYYQREYLRQRQDRGAAPV